MIDYFGISLVLFLWLLPALIRLMVFALCAFAVVYGLPALGRWISLLRREQRQRAFERTIAVQRARADDTLLAHLPKERADYIRARVDLTLACVECGRGDLVACAGERESV